VSNSLARHVSVSLPLLLPKVRRSLTSVGLLFALIEMFTAAA